MKKIMFSVFFVYSLLNNAQTPCNNGMAGSYPCNGYDLQSFIPFSTFNTSGGNDSWGWTDPDDGNEYAIMGLKNGTAFIDISDPINPVYLGKLPTYTSNSTWRDIKVYQNHAFVVSEAGGHGMQVFDLTRLRNVAN
ncbi:MAG: choice-of-anchor B family protein, partial [Flavobacteriales bacterium]